jgi:hypothetical protein
MLFCQIFAISTITNDTSYFTNSHFRKFCIATKYPGKNKPTRNSITSEWLACEQATHFVKTFFLKIGLEWLGNPMVRLGLGQGLELVFGIGWALLCYALSLWGRDAGTGGVRRGRGSRPHCPLPGGARGGKGALSM